MRILGLGGWDISEPRAGNLIGFKTVPDSRSLSVSLIPNTTTPKLCIFLESVSGNITALHGQTSLYGSSPNSNPFISDVFYYPWAWQDISYNLYTSSPNTTFCPPVANGLAEISIPINNNTIGNASPDHSVTFELCTGGNYSVATSGNCSTFTTGEIYPIYVDVALQAVFYDPNITHSSTTWYQNGSFHSCKSC